MTLGELIAELGQMDQSATVTYGFGEPMSYRGSYDELAFEPVANANVADMLAHAKSALGRTFTGYKGGDYAMHDYTVCWISQYGQCSHDGISSQLVNYWKKETEA